MCRNGTIMSVYLCFVSVSGYFFISEDHWEGCPLNLRYAFWWLSSLDSWGTGPGMVGAGVGLAWRCLHCFYFSSTASPGGPKICHSSSWCWAPAVCCLPVVPSSGNLCWPVSADASEDAEVLVGGPYHVCLGMACYEAQLLAFWSHPCRIHAPSNTAGGASGWPWCWECSIFPTLFC